MTGSIRQRIVAAAIEQTSRSGWQTITMARLATVVGVSRQTVYNEIGSKPELAEAMVLDELGRFLAVVTRAFEDHPAGPPDALPDAVRAAVRGVLELASDNVLLRAIVTATHGVSTDFLPLLTTHAGSLIATAKATLTTLIRPYHPPITGIQLDTVIDLVVRAVLSHVMQPSDTPAHTADGIAWVADRIRGEQRAGT